MSGPHAIWSIDREGYAPSAVKVARVRQRMTLSELAGRAGYSTAHVHRLEVRGVGSADLRRRVGQALGLEVLPPARGKVWSEDQLMLFGASSS